MPRACSVCSHAERPAINEALAAKTPYRTIADRYGLSETALKRHKKEHLPQTLVKAQEVEEVTEADDLLGQITDLRHKSLQLLRSAEQAGDYRTALAGVKEARACIETLLEVEGKLNRRPQVNLTLSPQWITARAVILEALHEHPDAAVSVAEGLQRLEEGQAS